MNRSKACSLPSTSSYFVGDPGTLLGDYDRVINTTFREHGGGISGDGFLEERPWA